MSTAETGTMAVVEEAMARSKAVVEQAAAEEAEQLDLLGAPTPEEIADARERLGPNAGRLTVLREARRGRPKGARNKRTDDYSRFLLSYGRDPGIAQIQIANTAPEVLIENSRRTVTKVLKDGNIVTFEETMSYAEAISLILRASEGIQPFINSKKPVAVDMSIHSDFNLIEEIIEGGELGIQDGEFLEIQGPAGDGAEGGE